VTSKPPDTMAGIAAIIEAVTDELEYLMITRDWPREARVAMWLAVADRATELAIESRLATMPAPKRRAGKMRGNADV
jgi:hypothetical protein